MCMTKHGAELAATLTKRNAVEPKTVLETCSLICRHAATIKRLAEAYCNRELSTDEKERDRMCEARIRELVKALIEAGCKQVTGVEFQGDPRGATVKLIVNDHSGDSWGGDDRLCVPGS